MEEVNIKPYTNFFSKMALFLAHIYINKMGQQRENIDTLWMLV